MGIKEAFAKLSQETAEYRASVTNLTNVNIHLATQVEDQSKKTATKDAAMETMSKLIQKSRGKSRPWRRSKKARAPRNPTPRVTRRETDGAINTAGPMGSAGTTENNSSTIQADTRTKQHP